ncbi:MAG: HEAT repeat domain-containing protein [Planctomycetes bacterium]|nr:HEAT repeat domain-containing protein [Planctomycetota bacterium]
MNKQPIFFLLPTVATALLLGSLALAEEPAKPGPREIRQGGYVEKVDPNVDYKARLPRIPPREPADSLAGMHVVAGFRVELAAAEPLVADAVDVAFDEDGRMVVAEMIPYAEGNTSKYGSPGGRVSVLEDTDGDGTFDRGTVLVDRLVWPTGVLCFDGGVFIAAAPDLLYCKDTDGDGRADVREVVVTGFELSNPNALPNSLRWGLDSRIHGMTSTAGGLLVPVQWNAGVDDPAKKVAPVQARGRDFSIDPRSGEMRLESGGSQHGMTFDAWGRKFESSNSAPIEMVMYDDRYLARNPMLAAPAPRERIWTHGMVVYPTAPPEPWRVVRTEMRIGGVFSGPVEGGGKPGGYFTAACGLTIYTGDAWPEAFRGDALVCEGAGNLVHRMKLEPRGVGFSAYRTEPGHEFWTSDEVWFRPIQFANAPDGTLYLADMYREIFEHPDAVPPSVKKHMSLTAGNDRGRIYRIVPDEFQPRPPVRLGRMSTGQLVALLKHANGWHRQTAARLLYQKQDPAAVDPLVALAAESESPLGRMHAMHALAGQNALPAEVVLGRLNDPHPCVREHAVRLAEHVLIDAPAVRERLYAMADDDDPRVRYQAAFTLGEIPGSRATAALARVAKHDVGDRWVRLAVLSSCYGRAGELFAELATDRTWRATTNGRTFLAQMAEQAGLQDQADQVAEVFKTLETFAEDEKPLAEAVVAGLNRGLTKSNSPLRERLATGSARELLAEMVARAKSTAVDTKQPIETRTEAIGSLALASFEDVVGVLPELFQSRQAAAVQTASLRALGRFRDPRVAAMIVDAWAGFSPQVRGEAAEALFARRQRLTVLLSAVEDESISPSQLDPARIRFLLNHPDAEIRDRATRLLGTAKLARREEVVAGYRDVLEMQAEPTRGKAVFKRECATCHRLEGEGYDLGLPLATVQSRGREGILVQILDPNREVNPTYLNYVAVTDDGRSLTGMIAAETATSITLRRAEGESDTILRGNIDELQSTSLSIMPEGLEEKLPKRDMADLIGYLMSM